MLTFSKREEYGIAVVTRLARHYGEKPVSLTTIAREEGIALPFLRQIALDLRHAGLLTAIEGKNGGYQLAKKPKEISLADVIEAVNKKELITCCDPRGEYLCACHEEQDYLWRKLNRHYIKNYYRITFDRLT